MKSRIVFCCIAVVVAEIMLGMVTPLFLHLADLLAHEDLFMALSAFALVMGSVGLVVLLITAPVANSVYWRRSVPHGSRVI